MSEVSFGNAGPKTRSINVGANLLTEWIQERARRRREVARSLAAIAGVVVAMAVAWPLFQRSTGAATTRAASLRARIRELDAALALSEQEKKEAEPARAVEAMRERTQASFDRLAQEVDRTLRAGSARTVLSTLHGDVQAGEIHLVVQAEAEEDGAADAFARNAGEAGASVDAITSSRPSGLLGARGLAFQYERRTKVAP